MIIMMMVCYDDDHYDDGADDIDDDDEEYRYRCIQICLLLIDMGAKKNKEDNNKIIT